MIARFFSQSAGFFKAVPKKEREYRIAFSLFLAMGYKKMASRFWQVDRTDVFS